MDETRIDAAPTPAHVFAYRAFRSVFVRSPESSPVKAGPTPRPHSLDVFDDFAVHRVDPVASRSPSPTRPSRFTVSPTRAKRKDQNGDVVAEIEEDLLRLTPKRQKMVVVSPSKSILRNKNTPRRAGLRDATVTFQDLRKSCSPELGKREVALRVKSQPEFRQDKPTVQRTTHKDGVVGADTISGVKISQPAFVPSTNSDLERYKTQTEKEMRRLIKYASKWKENAKVLEQETNRLKGLLDEVMKENQRLETKLKMQDEQAQQFKQIKRAEANSESEQHEVKLGRTIDSRRGQDQNMDGEATKSRRSSRRLPPDDQLATAGRDMVKSVTTTLISHPKQAPARPHSIQRPVDDLEDLPDLPQDVDDDDDDAPPMSSVPAAGITRSQSTHNPISPAPAIIGDTHQAARVRLSRASSSLLTPQALPRAASHATVLNTDAKVKPLPLRSASTSATVAKISEERKASARARLALKRAGKAGDVGAAVSVSGHDKDKEKDQQPGVDSSRTNHDESELDWLAAA